MSGLSLRWQRLPDPLRPMVSVDGWQRALFTLPAFAAAGLVAAGAPGTALGFVVAALAGGLVFQPPKREPAAAPDISLALCDVIDDLVMYHDSRGGVTRCVANAPSLFAAPAEALLGQGFFDRIHVADRPGFLKAFHEALNGEAVVCVTLRLMSGEIAPSADGHDAPVFVWADMRLRASRDAAMGASGPAVISVTRNVTASREAAESLAVAQAEALKAIALKDRLLANVSHELRTPLNAILGFSEMLGEDSLAPDRPEKRREYARIIHSSAEHLLSVVNLVLDMSRIEAGKFEISPEPFELEPLIRGCADMLRLKCESGRVRLGCELIDGAQEIVADKRACRQILLNLMSNAIKFTPPGGAVTIGARSDGAMMHIFVTDNGIGIGAEDLPHLGAPFFQVRSSYDRAFEGAGLGLSLVRGLVGLHGGALKLESAPGAGTRVSVSLPLDCRLPRPAEGSASAFETIAAAPSNRGPHAARAVVELIPGREKRFA